MRFKGFNLNIFGLNDFNLLNLFKNLIKQSKVVAEDLEDLENKTKSLATKEETAKKDLRNVNNGDFLRKIQSVDGEGSEINADMVDGKHASDLANNDLSNVSDTTILNKVKNVDGDGSGLDADTVDTYHLTDIQNDAQTRVDNHSNTTSGVHGVTGNVVGDTDTQTLTNKTLSTGCTVVGADDVTNTPTANKVPIADTNGYLNSWINQGDGSGLNADMVDNKHASDLANSDLSNVSDITILNKIKNVDGSGSGLDADKLDGYETWSSNNYWGRIPVVRTDGVMEIGKYIDFHLSSGSSADYEPRLQALDSSNLAINGHKIWHAGNSGKGIVKLSMSANQSITGNVYTKMHFNVIDLNKNESGGSLGTLSNYNFTPNRAGYYLVILQVTIWSVQNGYAVQSDIRLNDTSDNSNITQVTNMNAGSSNATDISATSVAIAYCNGTTDYISGFGIHRDGSNSRTAYNYKRLNHMYIIYLGDW